MSDSTRKISVPCKTPLMFGIYGAMAIPAYILMALWLGDGAWAHHLGQLPFLAAAVAVNAYLSFKVGINVHRAYGHTWASSDDEELDAIVFSIIPIALALLIGLLGFVAANNGHYPFTWGEFVPVALSLAFAPVIWVGIYGAVYFGSKAIHRTVEHMADAACRHINKALNND